MENIEPYRGIAGIYEDIKPPYPERLIKDVILKTGLKLDDRLLEIGAGTGKATIQFRVHAIELGEDMAEILKDKCTQYPNVSVDIVPFEEWNCPDIEKYGKHYH